MKVINNSTVFKDDPIHNLNFELFEFDKSSEHICLHLDYLKPSSLELDKNYINILLDLELPNRYLEPSQALESIEQEDRYDYILTICPHVCKNRNAILEKTNKKCRYIYIAFPTSIANIPMYKKDIDFIFTGNYIYYLDWIKNKTNIAIIGRHNKHSNMPNCSYRDKLMYTSRAKAAIIHQEFPLRPDQVQKLNSFQYKDSCVVLENTVSQQKARLTEAALSKCLLLVKRDPFNLIEDFYPRNSFIYFNNSHELNSLLESVIQNYSKYIDMIEIAYEQAKNLCSTEALRNKIRNLK